MASLFERHYEGLCRFLASYVDSYAIREELIQDVFLALWEKRRTLNPGGTAAAYLYRAARNRALNWHRRRKRERKRASESVWLDRRHVSTPDEELRDRELSDAVRRAVERLPDRCRQCLELSRFGGLTYAEIAAVLEISPKTVEVHMGRALERLREDLAALAADRAS